LPFIVISGSYGAGGKEEQTCGKKSENRDAQIIAGKESNGTKKRGEGGADT